MVLYFSKKTIQKQPQVLKRGLILFLILFVQYTWAQQSICYGSIANYSVDTQENAGSGTIGSTYVWSVVGSTFKGTIGNITNEKTNVIRIDWKTTPAGIYQLEVQEMKDGCTGLKQILTVTILPLPSINLRDQSICEDPLTKAILNTAVLDTQLSAAAYSFKWFLESNLLAFTTPQITVNTLGNYSVEVINKVTNCSATDSASVFLSGVAVATVKTTEDFDEVQYIIVTVVSGIGNYEYSIDGVAFQDDPKFTVVEAGAYTVTVRDKNGCGAIALQVAIIKYPRFFTPNNDGFNDVWNLKGLPLSMNPVVSIFDRYGKLLRQFRVDDLGWDGTNQGGYVLPSDDYWFSVEYINAANVPAVFKSHFTLKR
jgi:gliding motility-associated-like protein